MHAFHISNNENYVVTPTRFNLYNHLNDLITLHEFRHDENNLNEAQRFGGLGGIIIEGVPGIGKSELVIAGLIERGYVEKPASEKETQKTLSTTTTTTTTQSHTDKIFYRMPVSMGVQEKENLLLKAFDQGAIVIIDEINSSPMMEDLLNSLLMGSKLNGDRPKKPGFMVIGTQNPVTMAGRVAPSNALSRRLTTVNLPPYPKKELISILQHRGVLRKVASEMAEAYQIKLAQARKNNLSPSPTLRRLFKVADAWVKNKNLSMQISKPKPKLPEEEYRNPIIEEPLKETVMSLEIGLKQKLQDTLNELVALYKHPDAIPEILQPSYQRIEAYCRDDKNDNDKKTASYLWKFDMFNKILMSRSEEKTNPDFIKSIFILLNDCYRHRASYQIDIKNNNEIDSLLNNAVGKHEFIQKIKEQMDNLSKKQSGFFYDYGSDKSKLITNLTLQAYNFILNNLEQSTPDEDLTCVLNRIRFIYLPTKDNQPTTIPYDIKCLNNNWESTNKSMNQPLTIQDILTMKQSGWETKTESADIWKEAFTKDYLGKKAGGKPPKDSRELIKSVNDNKIEEKDRYYNNTIQSRPISLKSVFFKEPVIESTAGKLPPTKKSTRIGAKNDKKVNTTDKDRQRLLDEISTVLKMKVGWSNETLLGRMPTGVMNIKNIIKKSSKDTDKVKLLFAIITVCDSRLKKKSDMRSSTTEAFYKAICSLNPDDSVSINRVKESLNTVKEQLADNQSYNQSKKLRKVA